MEEEVLCAHGHDAQMVRRQQQPQSAPAGPERGALLRRYEDEKGYKGGKPKGEIECAGMKFAVGGSQARVRWFRPRARPHITCRVAPHTSA